MLIVRATGKLRQRLGPTHPARGRGCDHAAGRVVRNRPVLAAPGRPVVNEPTLLPILMPLAPAATLPARIPQQIAAALSAHGAPASIVDEEARRMREWRLGPTSQP